MDNEQQHSPGHHFTRQARRNGEYMGFLKGFLCVSGKGLRSSQIVDLQLRPPYWPSWFLR
jgi:hypothetical protein